MVQGEHVVLDLLRHRSGFRIVVAINEDLHGRRNRLIVQLPEAHVGFGEVIGVFVVPFLQKVFGGLLRSGVDDELRQVVGRDARGVGRVETWCGLPDESRHGGDTAIGEHHLLQRVADSGGGFKAAALGKPDLHREAVTLGVRHHLHIEGEKHQDTQNDGADTHSYGEMRVLEAVALQLVVEALQESEELHLGFQEAVVSGLVVRLDEHDFQRRDDKHGVGQRGHQREGDSPGE